MSWSVSAMGKGEAVGKSLAAQFEQVAKYNMAEPENAMAVKAAEICQTACNGAPDQGRIVRGNGSQWTDNGVVKGLNFKLEIDLVALAE